MERMTQRQLKALQTKKKILETALYLFGKKGYNNVPVDEIVQVSNTSKGAFYTHFKSKHEVFLEKFKEIDNVYFDVINSIPEATKASDKLLMLTERQTDYLKNDLGLDLIRAIYINAIDPKTSRFLVDKNRPYFKIIQRIIQEGQVSGEFKGEQTPERISDLITRNVRGSLYDWCLHEEGEYDLVEETLDVMKLMIYGLKNSGT